MYAGNTRDMLSNQVTPTEIIESEFAGITSLRAFGRPVGIIKNFREILSFYRIFVHTISCTER